MPVKAATIFPLHSYNKSRFPEKEQDQNQFGQDISFLCSQLEAVECKIDEIAAQIEKIQIEQRKQENL